MICNSSPNALLRSLRTPLRPNRVTRDETVTSRARVHLPLHLHLYLYVTSSRCLAPKASYVNTLRMQL